jgi:ABC-type dipeptide/oligopeptide/nickel transport system permease component
MASALLTSLAACSSSLPQLLGILFVSFMLVKLIPGDPAMMMLGPFATDEGSRLRTELGLDRSILEQFGIYVMRVLQGDLGTSWQTTMPVTTDLAQRFPATFELVTLSLALALMIGIPLGVAGARTASGVLRKIADYYGLMAGSLPDFWFALVLIFIFYTMLGIAPAPLGRLDFTIIPPDR